MLRRVTRMATLDDLRAYLKENEARFLDELIEFLRVPSVSRLPEHAEDMQRAASWLEARIGGAGLEHVRLIPTAAESGNGAGPREGPPVVYGDWLHAGPDRSRRSSRRCAARKATCS